MAPAELRRIPARRGGVTTQEGALRPGFIAMKIVIKVCHVNYVYMCCIVIYILAGCTSFPCKVVYVYVYILVGCTSFLSPTVVYIYTYTYIYIGGLHVLPLLHLLQWYIYMYNSVSFLSYSGI